MDAELDLNCGLGNHDRGEGMVTAFLDEDPDVVFLSGNEGTAGPNPYEETSLAKEDSQFLTGVDDDDGLEVDKLTVKVLSSDSDDSNEFILSRRFFSSRAVGD